MPLIGQPSRGSVLWCPCAPSLLTADLPLACLSASSFLPCCPCSALLCCLLHCCTAAECRVICDLQVLQFLGLKPCQLPWQCAATVVSFTCFAWLHHAEPCPAQSSGAHPQVLRSLGLMPDMDIDELENLAQRVEIAKHQVCCLMFITLHLVALSLGLSHMKFTYRCKPGCLMTRIWHHSSDWKVVSKHMAALLILQWQ